LELLAHLARLLCQRREADSSPSLVDVLGILDRPRRDRAAVLGANELRAVELVSAVGHAHAIEEERVVRRWRVACRDGHLEHLETATLEPGVEHGALGEDPGGLLAVVVDEAAAGPALIVVEDLPESVAVGLGGRAAVGAVALGHRDQLDAQRRIVPHGWKDTAMGFLTSRLVRRLRPGIAATLGVEDDWRRYWEESNDRARRADGPLWVALGDSTAQGIGASAPDRGYVGQLLGRLREGESPAWRVVNLSVTGARLTDVVREQLPRVDEAGPPDLVTCAAGANDLVRVGIPRARRGLHALIDGLPSEAVLATCPQGLWPKRTLELNRIIRAEAPAAGLRIADVWAHTGPPWSGKYAGDGFHPNETGYADWCAAFAAAIGLDGP
jgi:lysophospholipase L1-like esterase